MKGDFEYNYNQGIYLNENYPEENPSEKPVMLPALLIDICHRNGPDIGIATYLTDDEVLKLKGIMASLCTKFIQKTISVAIFLYLETKTTFSNKGFRFGGTSTPFTFIVS